MTGTRHSRFISIGVIGFILMAVLTVAVVSWIAPSPGTVSYHERKMRRAFDRYMNPDNPEAIVESSMNEFEKHRDLLAELGHFEKLFFPLRPIDRLSDEFFELSNTVGQLLIESAGGLHLAKFVWNDDDRSPIGLQVWTTPENAAQWDAGLYRFTDSPRSATKESDSESEADLHANDSKRTRLEAIETARAVASEDGIDLHGWPEPDVRFDSDNGKWWVHFSRDRYPGDHFSVSIDDATGDTKLFRGR